MIIYSSLFGILVVLSVDGLLRYAVFAIWLIVFTILYLFVDKIILYIIGAREIIDSDYQTLFQYIKSASYQNFESTPKVYIYSGFSLKAFVLSSRNEWSIVLDRKLMDQLSSEQIKYLINYLVKFNKTSIPWRQTKSLGLNCFSIMLIYFFLRKVFFLSSNSYAFKILSFFLMILLKPLFELIAIVGHTRKSNISIHYSLESIVNINRELIIPIDFSSYAFSHIQNEIVTKEMMVKLIETIPVLETSQVEEVVQ